MGSFGRNALAGRGNFQKILGSLFENHSILVFLQINRENRQETEENIREALKSLMKHEEVEDELRRAIEGLNLEEPSVEETAQSRDS